MNTGKYCLFDSSFKISMCEEFFQRKKEDPSLKMITFANEKGIKKTTFYDWIRTYLEYQNNNSGVITTTAIEDNAVPKFVEITDRSVIDEVITSNKDNNVTLKYKDTSLEFDINNLDKVMEIIRRW